jgi:hypothetical protein
LKEVQALFSITVVETRIMPDGLWPVLLIIAFVFSWVVSKVIAYTKKSEQQWRDVDRSKLRDWEDDE